MKGNLFFLLIALNYFLIGTNGELMFATWILRHGAREPNKPSNEILKEFGKKFQGYRLLTNVGMRQQYILGRYFQEKYKDKFEISPQTVVIRSTVKGRTMTSGHSFIRGLNELSAKPNKM